MMVCSKQEENYILGWTTMEINENKISMWLFPQKIKSRINFILNSCSQNILVINR